MSIDPSEYYLTDEDYKRAASIGISARALNKRVYYHGWEKERAITTPTRKLRDVKKWRALAVENGIGSRLFDSRIQKGWPPEEAAKRPRMTPEARKEFMRTNNPRWAYRKYPPELLEAAKRVGVSPNTFRARVRRLSWDPERAAKEPLVSRKERGRRGAAAFRLTHGDVHGWFFISRKS